MPRHLLTHAERPDLADRVDFNVWPAYNRHGDVLNRRVRLPAQARAPLDRA
jgi:hypothetical protein